MPMVCERSKFSFKNIFSLILMELSFCITCMNRLHQISQTLLTNLKHNNNQSVEFILVDFNSSDGLKEYILDNNEFKRYLDTKQLKYNIIDRLKFWHASIAKNTAHNLATGKIVVNLDCDNYIGENGGDFIINIFKENNYNIILSQSKNIYGSGTFGRISLLKNNFIKLGGYDESFYPMGYQDTDLINRAVKYNLKLIHIDKNNKAIKNTKQDSIKNCNTNISYNKMEMFNKLKSNINIENNELTVNKYKNTIGI